MPRQTELDSLRGLLLVLMTITHLPVSLSAYTAQPLGFVSAAEGFVLLSAFFTSLIHLRGADRLGTAAARRSTWRRALQLYACHLGLLALTLTLMAAIGVFYHRPALRNLVSFYLEHPLAAVLGGPFLLYRPPLLDILPMYVLFIFASPLVLAFALRRGWFPVLAASVAVWLAAQLGARAALHAAIAAGSGLPMPLGALGAFNLLSWQLLWVGGLWLGARRAAAMRADAAAGPVDRSALPRSLVVCCAALSAAFLAWRHELLPLPVAARDVRPLLSKWDLGPLRLLNLAALGVVFVAWGLPLLRLLQLKTLALLGRASLPVFCAHLLLCLLSLGLLDENETPLSLAAQLLLLVATLGALLAIAKGYEHRRAQSRAPRNGLLPAPESG